ncbi:outer membrane beta-barrel protein [Pelagibacterium lacus]|uniref:Uncharacterized protein n=1 Tax=Pelagibacterium lacus TaxID=2282655 RepID=A0A369W337_9HYPH|nr:outer membrane beta-barrel protein [Pelagibacterium lacus]RDE08397.1 hypothetical protein DVH29_11755 [Pelagibacterium lacus]
MLRPAHIFAVLCLAGTGSAGFAALALAQGEGSGTDNPDLLRGSYAAGCAPGTLCDFPQVDLFAPPIVRPMPLPAAPAVAPAPLLPPVAAMPATLPMLPIEAGAIQPRTEWEGAYALGLRGAYVRTGSEERFELLAIPQISFSRAAAATRYDFDANATIVAPDSSDMRLGGAGVSGTIEHRLAPGAALVFNADLDIEQDAPDGLGVDEANVAQAPTTLSGGVSAAYGQRFGQFDLTLSAGLSNRWMEPTLLADGTMRDNAYRSALAYEGGLRLGYAATPILGTFVSGEIGREDYLAADPDLLASRSGMVASLRAGVTGNWSDVITAEASIGTSWRDYDSPLVRDAQAWLYGVSLGFAPTSTTQFTAGFETELAAGSGASGADAVYLASLAAHHRINPWLALRASASAQWDVPVDGSATARTYGAGLGTELAIGPHASAEFDYGYGWRDDGDPAAPPRDEHRISGGVTLRY